MAKNEKTIADFNKLVNETKTKFNHTKMDFNLNYNIKEEKNDSFESFYICNRLEGVKILYSHEMKIIVHREIIMSDMRILMEMGKDL